MNIKRTNFRLPVIAILLLLLSNTAFPQRVNNSKDVTSDDKALFFFIEGKTLELRNNYIGAIENYRTALKYDKSPGIYHALADVYYRLSKPDEAFTEIKNALKLSPQNQNYLETLANIYIQKRDFRNAATTYEEIIRLDSNYTYGLYSLARLYQEMKMPAMAIIIYEKITSKIGYDFDVLNKMYDIYISYKDYGKAVESLEALLKLDPFNSGIKKILATLYLRADRIDDARFILEELFVLNPQDKDIQTELVKIYFKKNESEKAFENFSKMLGKDSLGYWEKVQIGELYYNMISQDQSAKGIAQNIFSSLNSEYPDQWIPYYYLGAIDVINNDVSGYKEKFERAVQNADTSREVFINIGLTYFQRNEGDEAVRILDEGLIKFPDDYRMNYIKGLSLQQLNREDEAMDYFEKAVQLNSTDIVMLSTIALAYDNRGNYKRSSDLYEMALKIDPQNALVLNNYAYNLSERGENLERALGMSKIAVEKDPENASYLDTIGWIYFKLKNYKLAKSNIERSLFINPNSAVVLEHLGDVYNAMKDSDNALKYWKMSLEKNPNNRTLSEKINFYN